MLIPLYRALSRFSAGAIRWHMRRRLAAGKEDPARGEERFGQAMRPRPAGPLVWLHAASVGESLSVLPLIEGLLVVRPDLAVLVTTGTVTSAILMAERLPAGAFHQYAPLDLPVAVARFLDHWRPDLALWVESELWPNTLLALEARRIPVVLVNARLSDRSFARWHRLRRTAARLLRPFEICLAPDREVASRLEALGAARVEIVGNLKLAAAPLPADAAALEALRAALAGRRVWIAASTHPGEEMAVARVHRQLSGSISGLLSVIAPRHPARGAVVEGELARAGLRVARRSTGAPIGEATQVYLADTMGELGLLYRVAEIAFVGGSLVGHGGQNPLEPARLGIPVLYGPHMHNFREACALLEAAGAARPVAQEAELGAALGTLLADPQARGRMAAAAAGVAERRSVVEATLAVLHPLLPEKAD